VPAIHANGGLSNTATFTWTTPGPQVITVTASNSLGAVSNTHVITVESSSCANPLQDVSIEGPIGVTGTLYIGTSYLFGTVITPTDATLPITYTWSPLPDNGQNVLEARYHWGVSGVYTIEVMAENCGGVVDAVRQVDIAHRDLEYIYLPLVVRNR
jgi:hypothetical protein